MSERLSAPRPAAERHLGRAAVQAGLIVLLYGGVAAGCGWLWFELWSPPATGVVAVVEQGKVWVPEPYVEGHAAEFSGTGWYVVVACGAGVLVGFLAGALVYRHELLVLGAVAVGSLLAAWVMYRVGVWLSPPDPQQLAQSSPEGATLEAALVVHGRSPFLAFPIGSCLGLSASLLGFTRRPTNDRDSGLSTDFAG